MQTFDVSIFPRANRANIDGLDLVVTQPSLDFCSDKLGATIATDIAGHPILDHRLFQHALDLFGGDLPFDLDG